MELCKYSQHVILMVTDVNRVYGYLNMFFTSFPDIFEGLYGFSVGSVGLTYIAAGTGELMATAFSTWAGNKIYHRVCNCFNSHELGG